MESTTVLFEKWDIVDDAQFGTQRFRANVVVPRATVGVHVDQRVAVTCAFASAQLRTNSRGLTTGEPLQDVTATSERVEAVALDVATGRGEVLTAYKRAPSAAPATPSAATQSRLTTRRRRARRRASLKRSSASSGLGVAVSVERVKVIIEATIISINDFCQLGPRGR